MVREARSDFRTVVKLEPSNKEARTKFAECDSIIKKEESPYSESEAYVRKLEAEANFLKTQYEGVDAEAEKMKCDIMASNVDKPEQSAEPKVEDLERQRELAEAHGNPSVKPNNVVIGLAVACNDFRQTLLDAYNQMGETWVAYFTTHDHAESTVTHLRPDGVRGEVCYPSLAHLVVGVE